MTWKDVADEAGVNAICRSTFQTRASRCFFLRPFIDPYATLSAIYQVVNRAYTKTVYVDRDFQRKTNELVQGRVDVSAIGPVTDFVEINEETVELIKQKKGGDATKVINLIKSIEKAAQDSRGDPFLIAMAERAEAVRESFEDRQKTTEETLSELFAAIENNEKRKKEQAEKGFDAQPFSCSRQSGMLALASRRAWHSRDGTQRGWTLSDRVRFGSKADLSVVIADVRKVPQATR